MINDDPMRTEHYTTLIAVIAILVIGAILALGVLYPNGLLQNRKTVTISASGSASAMPQQSVVDLYINGTGNTTQIATANLSLTLATLNTTLLKYTTPNMISTQYYTLGAVYNSTAFAATEGLRVVVPSASDTDALLQGISSIRNVYVQGASASLSDGQIRSMTSQALRAAMANATSQAEALTGNASLTASNLSTSSFRVYQPFGLSTGLSSPSAITAKGNGQLLFTSNESVIETVQVVFTYS